MHVLCGRQLTDLDKERRVKTHLDLTKVGKFLLNVLLGRFLMYTTDEDDPSLYSCAHGLQHSFESIEEWRGKYISLLYRLQKRVLSFRLNGRISLQVRSERQVGL